MMYYRDYIRYCDNVFQGNEILSQASQATEGEEEEEGGEGSEEEDDGRSVTNSTSTDRKSRGVVNG